MARGFVYLTAVLDWFNRRVLAWRLSITLEAEFCLDAMEEGLARHVWPVLRDAWLAWAGARLPRIALAYAGLAFLGLGADAGRPDWGAMVWEYRTYALAAPWLPMVPVLGLATLTLGLRAALGRAEARVA